MTEAVHRAVAEGVGTITFNRPQVFNALDDEMIHALRVQCEELAGDASVRCVVLRGAGAAFLAGGDVSFFHARLNELPALSVRLARELHLGVLALRRMPKPVLASVHGAVAGAGLSLMTACDLAIAADDARFTTAYTRIGTSPDGGGTYFMARSLGARKALELALLSETFDAAQALALGLINRVVPAGALLAETAKLARRLADGPTLAYAETKKLIESAQDATLESHLEAEAQAFGGCARSEDMEEGVRAFVEKRAARFRGR